MTVTAQPRVIGHRGNSSVAPENTLAAIESAIRCGADGVEVDLQLTADHVPVVIHDADLDRTTDGSGPLAQTSAEALRHLDAGSWFSPAFAHQRVPHLAELLVVLTRAPHVALYLELKGVWAAPDVRLVARAVAEHGLEERVLAQSFSVVTVAVLAAEARALRRGLLVDSGEGDLVALCRDLGAVTCNPHGRVLLERPQLVEQLHDAGLTTTVWTLNEPADWARATELGVDGIITDRPDRLLGWRAKAPTPA